MEARVSASLLYLLLTGNSRLERSDKNPSKPPNWRHSKAEAICHKLIKDYQCKKTTTFFWGLTCTDLWFTSRITMCIEQFCACVGHHYLITKVMKSLIEDWKKKENVRFFCWDVKKKKRKNKLCQLQYKWTFHPTPNELCQNWHIV